MKNMHWLLLICYWMLAKATFIFLCVCVSFCEIRTNIETKMRRKPLGKSDVKLTNMTILFKLDEKCWFFPILKTERMYNGRGKILYFVWRWPNVSNQFCMSPSTYSRQNNIDMILMFLKRGHNWPVKCTYIPSSLYFSQLDTFCNRVVSWNK